MMVSYLLGLAVIAALAALGALLTRAILVKASWLELLSLSYPLGSGVLTWLLFNLSWLGLPISAISVAVTAFVAAGAAVWIARIRRLHLTHRIPDRQAKPQEGRTALDLPSASALALGLVMLIAIAISVGRSYAAYDAMAGWAIKGYGIAFEGSILAGREWGMWSLNYPLNIMMQVATFRLFGSDILPESKLLFPAYLASVCLGVFIFWRRQRVPRALAGMGMLLIATNPVAFIQSTNGYANLPFSAILTLGVLTGIDALKRRDPSRQFLSGLLLAIGVWTRPEGVLYVAPIAASIWLIARIGRYCRGIPVAFMSPLAVVSIPWLMFAWTHYELDPVWIQHGDTAALAMAGLVERISGRDAHWFDLYLIVRLFAERALQPKNWGAYTPVVGSLVAISLFRKRNLSRMEIRCLAAATAIGVAIPIALYFALSLQGWPDFVDILRRDFDRAYLPGYLMTNVLAIALLASQSGERIEGIRQPILQGPSAAKQPADPAVI